MGSLLPGGWPELMAANHGLALAARDLLCAAFEVDAPAPDDMLGSMATVPLPEPASSARLLETATIGEELFRDYRIEIPVIEMADHAQRYVRLSAQRYNTLDQYARLGDALVAIMGAGADRADPGPDPVVQIR